MEHIWTIYDLERVTSDGMVTKVTWACESYLEEKFVRYVGDTTLTTGSASDSDFVNWNDLTKDTVLSWVTGSINQSTIETNNSSSIATQIINDASITKKNGIPW